MIIKKKAAAMQMIEALDNDSIVVPDQFLKELSSKVDEFKHMLGLSKEETKYFLYKRLLAQYSPNKRARYNEYVDR
jgi:predicted nucleic acid-binding protein